MLSINVTDNSTTEGAVDVRPASTFTINGAFSTLMDIKDAIFRKTRIDPDQQLLFHGDRFMFGDEDYFTRFDLRAVPAISLHRRLPDDQVLAIRVRRLRRGDVQCSFRADLPVYELKSHLARKYCMAPWKQVLMTHKAPMLDPDSVGAYATTTQMDVSLSEYFDGQEPTPWHITVVVDADKKKRRTFLVERRDTLDVLLGHLERAGMVGDDEVAGFMRNYVPLDRWKSFEDHHVPDHGTLSLIRKQEN